MAAVAYPVELDRPSPAGSAARFVALMSVKPVLERIMFYLRLKGHGNLREIKPLRTTIDQFIAKKREIEQMRIRDPHPIPVDTPPMRTPARLKRPCPAGFVAILSVKTIFERIMLQLRPIQLVRLRRIKLMQTAIDILLAKNEFRSLFLNTITPVNTRLSISSGYPKFNNIVLRCPSDRAFIRNRSSEDFPKIANDPEDLRGRMYVSEPPTDRVYLYIPLRDLDDGHKYEPVMYKITDEDGVKVRDVFHALIRVKVAAKKQNLYIDLNQCSLEGFQSVRRDELGSGQMQAAYDSSRDRIERWEKNGK